MQETHMKNIFDTLVENGLTQQEARIYITCLELGTAPASRIASKLGENKVTVYSTLKKMIQEGLILSTQKKNTAYYSAISPELLYKKREVTTQKLKDSLSILTSLGYQHFNRLDTKLYEGIEGLKNAFMEMINTNIGESEFLAITGTGGIDQEFELWLNTVFLPYRSTIPYKSRTLLCQGTTDSYFQYSIEQHKYVIIDNPLYIFENEIVIYGSDKIAILNYKGKDRGAIIITSKSLFNTLSTLFHITRDNYSKKQNTE